MTAPRWHRVKSSTLHSVAHDRATLELRVAFRAPRGHPEKGGSTYLYRGVPRAVYDALVETNRKRGSVGRSFIEIVRKKFAGEKIEGGPLPQKKVSAGACPRCGGVLNERSGLPHCRSCGWSGEEMASQGGSDRHPVELIEDKIIRGDEPAPAAGEAPDLYELMERVLKGGDL